MTREIQPHQTPSRRAWLETLERGPARRGKSATGFHCMRLGWTRWVDIADGSLEELTDAGRAVLAEWRAEGKKQGKPSDAEALEWVIEDPARAMRLLQSWIDDRDATRDELKGEILRRAAQQKGARNG